MERSNSYSDGRNSRLQIVPWYNKKEWQETYQQAYSDDVELQERAYTQMCIWKTRYPNLPLGVECTMSMLHVRLCDKQGDGSNTAVVYKDRDLQLLYSTAVMRFLNHVNIISNHKDSMYKMAEQHELPDWLINLRHEAAHGNSVPALFLLRQAGDIIMQWLHDNYWEMEADVMIDVVKEVEGEREIERKKIEELLHLWLVLKVNYWAGYKTIVKIPSEEIRIKAMELAVEEGCGIKLNLEGGKRISPKRRKKDQSAVENEIIKEEETEVFTHKIKTAFEPLLRRIFDPLKRKTFKKTVYQECLIDCLMKYEGFCPQIDLDQLEESEVLQLMSLMGELWKEVLEGLQSHKLLHCLLKRLMCDTCALTAHLWLRLLTHLLSGESLSHPMGSESLCNLLANSLPYEVDPKVLLQKVNLHHVKHHRPLNLSPASAQEIEILQYLAQDVLQNPTRFTSTYLDSLLGFWETSLSTDTKNKLCALARIYNGRQKHRKRPVQVYTLASLLDHGLVIDELDSSTDDSSSQDASPWKLYSGDANWSQCALGVLPW